MEKFKRGLGLTLVWELFIGSLMQLITTRKVAHNHMIIISLIDIAYITNFLYRMSLYN